MQPALIAVDWGSSSFRAYLMSAGAEVLDETSSGDGIASVAAGAYPATLKRLIGRWLDANSSAPVIASGMVGSRHGWREAPYVRCPAGPHDLARRLTTVEADGRRVFLAPGLSTEDEAGLPDVMRGEETEIFGVADLGVHLGAAAHRAARIAFEMGQGRGRPRRGVQDLRDRRIVPGAARPHDRRRLRQGRAGRRRRETRSRSGLSAARRPRAARRRLASSASCSARALSR